MCSLSETWSLVVTVNSSNKTQSKTKRTFDVSLLKNWLQQFVFFFMNTTFDWVIEFQFWVACCTFQIETFHMAPFIVTPEQFDTSFSCYRTLQWTKVTIITNAMNGFVESHTMMTNTTNHSFCIQSKMWLHANFRAKPFHSGTFADCILILIVVCEFWRTMVTNCWEDDEKKDFQCQIIRFLNEWKFIKYLCWI